MSLLVIVILWQLFDNFQYPLFARVAEICIDSTHLCCIQTHEKPYLVASENSCASFRFWLFLAKIRCHIQPILFHTFDFIVLQLTLQMARLIFPTFDLWKLKRKILLVLALLGPYIFVAFLR